MDRSEVRQRIEAQTIKVMLEQKIDNLTKGAKAFRRLFTEVKKILYQSVLLVIALWGAWVYRYELRDFMLDQAIDSKIHEDVVQETTHNQQFIDLLNKVNDIEVIANRAKSSSNNAVKDVNALKLRLDGTDSTNNKNIKLIFERLNYLKRLHKLKKLPE